MDAGLPPIPAKRYFTIGEVSELCGVKPYVLRYWEQEFAQLRPMKRRGNRRYYQHHEVLLVRRIRELLYDQGFTIVGARNRLAEAAGRAPARAAAQAAATAEPGADAADTATAAFTPAAPTAPRAGDTARPARPHQAADLRVEPCAELPVDLRAELLALRELLST